MNDIQDYPLLMTRHDVCAYLQISLTTLYRYINQGVLPATRINGAWCFNKKRLLKCLDQNCSHLDSELWSKRLLVSIRKRARKKSLSIDIRHEDIIALWRQQEGRCVLTGIRFTDKKYQGRNKRPYIPSIDRIDNNKGYVKGNIRLVCCAVNLALHTWDLELFDKIAKNRLQVIENHATK